MRVLTGIQPSGKIHLGNYFSAIRQILNYQSKQELFLFLASLHSLTSFQSQQIQKENSFDLACDLLALGVDPKQCIFWNQSDVPEVLEITWYLSMEITTSQLSLAHSFKDKIAKGIVPSGGLYIYPILMAADILSFDADIVPVGKDQKQHLEFAIDMGESFNRKFGPIFKIPKPAIDDSFAIVPGTDGAKMSKSYGNTINIFDSEKDLKKKVMSIISDSSGIEEVKDPNNSVIFSIYSLFLDEPGKEKLKGRYANPPLQYGDLKKEILELILEYFRKPREEKQRLLADRSYVYEVLEQGKQKAKQIIVPKLQEIRNVLGISF